MHFINYINCKVYTVLKIIIIYFCISFESFSAQNNLEKKIQWGLGFVNIYGNHYRGSNQEKSWFFPMPYFSYRSDTIEAEPSFIRGIFYRNQYLALKFSLMLGLRVESDENTARKGMKALDYTVEAGPMLIMYLWELNNNQLKLNLEIPIRSVYATNLKYINYVGYFTVPYLNIIYSPGKTNRDWNAELSLSPMFADQKYHQYFYAVEKQFENSHRSYYMPHGGYSGFQAALVINKKWGPIVLIPFVRWDYLKNAVFLPSPLVKTLTYTIAGIGIFYLF